ncbi:hypothetical protein D8674_017372 [Pyrus ussuriensis x Pyrus communis]|uniref:Uncharacterized protein n=1 Tax=Pyrus ussuriensis x Pyrus communis TaxID=2448454 RepID=A0A5N5HHX4_9ROSA|nr:hypothetical protein D8674_017372 [Pyrus ussuriensis x Pyrus communis]
MGTFVKCFRDLAFDCYDKKDKETLMEICISNIVADYMVYLENIRINQFLRLLEAIKKTSLSIKPSTGRSWKFDKNEAYHTLAVDDRSDYNPQKKKERKSDRETYLPLVCSDEEFQVILDTMLRDKYVEHPSIVCQTLRKNVHAKIHEGTLELPCKT